MSFAENLEQCLGLRRCASFQSRQVLWQNGDAPRHSSRNSNVWPEKVQKPRTRPATSGWTDGRLHIMNTPTFNRICNAEWGWGLLINHFEGAKRNAQNPTRNARSTFCVACLLFESPAKATTPTSAKKMQYNTQLQPAKKM